jgi:hypothetical protein
VADLDRSLAFVMDPSGLNGGGLPGTALEALREAGIEARILEEIIREHGPQVLSQREAIETVIASAVTGGTLHRAARDLDVHANTLSRRLKGVGLSPRWLRRWARLKAYELRVEQGMDRSAALVVGGWTDPEQRRKAVVRLRDG